MKNNLNLVGKHNLLSSLSNNLQLILWPLNFTNFLAQPKRSQLVTLKKNNLNLIAEQNFLSCFRSIFYAKAFRVAFSFFYFSLAIRSSVRGAARVKNPGGQVVMQSKILTSVSYKAPSDLPKSAPLPLPLLHPCVEFWPEEQLKGIGFENSSVR